MSNKTVPTLTFTPYDFTSQTQHYFSSSEIAANLLDSYLDCRQELPIGKSPIADAPPAFDLSYGAGYTLFPSTNWSFESVDSVGYSDFQGSFGSSDSFSTSPSSSNPNSPSSSIHSELSDTSSPMWDQSLFMAHNPPSPYALNPIENSHLNGVSNNTDLNKRKRSLEDVYQPILHYSPENMSQGEHVINELFANGGVCLEPYEFQSDSSSNIFSYSIAADQTIPSVNIFNTHVPSLSPTTAFSAPSSLRSNYSTVTPNNGINRTHTISTPSSGLSKSSSVNNTFTSTASSKNNKKGRRLSNSSKPKNSTATVKKEVIANTNTSCSGFSCGMESSMGVSHVYPITNKRSMRQLQDVISTLDHTMKGGLIDGLNYLAQLAKNGPNDISVSDIPAEMLKISMANSVMGMLYPRSLSQLPVPIVPIPSKKQITEVIPTISIASNKQSHHSMTSTPSSYNNSAYLNSASSPSIKEEPTSEEAPTNKRKKARSNQMSTQTSKASSFRFNVINSVNSKQQSQRLSVQQPQQSVTSMVTVL